MNTTHQKPSDNPRNFNYWRKRKPLHLIVQFLLCANAQAISTNNTSNESGSSYFKVWLNVQQIFSHNLTQTSSIIGTIQNRIDRMVRIRINVWKWKGKRQQIQDEMLCQTATFANQKHHIWINASNPQNPENHIVQCKPTSDGKHRE